LDKPYLSSYPSEYFSGIINHLKKNKFMNIETPAVMFDIDDTLIDSISRERIEPMYHLLNECIKENYNIIIITARDSQYTKETKQELSRLNVRYDLLFLRDPKKDEFYYFKDIIKKSLSEHDIDIIMSVGDHEHDVSGDYSGYFIKLPNYQDPRLFHLNNNKLIEEIV
jgi:predicted HAD superfamily phosphohydrolase YqeG